MTVPVSKRYSTWCNLITIVSGAAMPFLSDIVPSQYHTYVMMCLAIITAMAQGINQGKFDDQQN